MTTRISKAWSQARLLPPLLLLLLSACRGSTLGDQFFQGAKRQEGLDTESLYLWERSPATASQDSTVLSTTNLDNVISKTLRYFSHISDVNAPLRSADIIVHYSHINEDAPSFYKWAGKHVPWKDNSDFRALFAYAEADAGIAYIDGLISASFLVEDPTKLMAWRKAVCTGPVYGTSSCASASALVSAPALPVVLSVDNETLPSGSNARVVDAAYCPFFNSEYYLGSGEACLNRDTLLGWKNEWDAGHVRRQISFYKDSTTASFNAVDDGDVILRELAHVLHTALNPSLVEISATHYPLQA
ncbi:MAG: hypothetical protein ABIR96_04585, partial [Bdellovibrionota bacterium]